MSHHSRAICRAFLVSVVILFFISTSLFPNIVLATDSSPKSIDTSPFTDVEVSKSLKTECRSTSQLDDQRINVATRFFTENQGQLEEAAKFITTTEFGKAIFCDSKILYAQNKYENGNLSVVDFVTLTFPGSNLVTPKGEGLESHRSNFFIGDPSNWVVGARNYRTIEYQNLWDGVDLIYKFSEQGLKYEFIVAPFVPIDQVRVRVEGASLTSDANSLTFNTGQGYLTDGLLMALYKDSGESLPATFVIQGDQFGFNVPQRTESKGVIIDPLVYSTYIGGSGDDVGYSIAVDSNGNAYVTGYTNSTNFPLANAYQTTNHGGSDVFILKLNPAGSALLYSTYIGGSGDDVGYSIAVDSNGNAYVTGYTNSTNFPLANAYQTTNHGGSDVFILKLNSTGSALLYSTYIGGSGGDYGHSIAIDSNGNIYVTGRTTSTNFPLRNAYQTTNHGGSDVFILKLNSTGSALLYSTYIGGSGGDYGYSIAIDSIGNAYVSGRTTSTNFPLANAYQSTNHGGYDAFVLKLNPAGSALLYSTYIGGSGDDDVYSSAVDSNGNAYVTGATNSTDFPLANAYQSTNHGGFDVFVFKLNSTGSALLYSTYIGGGGNDGGISIAVDSIGNAYVTGHTFSTNFPLANAYQSTNHGGYDAFVLKLNPAGSALLYSTYIGGNSWDRGVGLAVDSNGNAYVTGHITSTDFPVVNAYQSTYGGGDDAFVFKFGYSTVPTAPQNLEAVGSNAQITLTWQSPAHNGGWDITNYTVYRGTTSGGETLLITLGNVLTYTGTGLTNGQIYYYKVSAVNWAGEGPQSNEASATPLSMPSAPQNLKARAGGAQITLTWQEPSSNGGTAITGYRVYQGMTSGGETVLTTLGNVLTYVDTGLTNGQTYYYKVSAINALGESSLSNEASATPATIPSAPQNLQATAGDAQVTLTWQGPSSNGGAVITNYTVYRGTTSGGETLLITLGKVLTYTGTGLTNGQIYYYKVSAVNWAGEGPQSNEASATPLSMPSAPQNIHATADDAQVTLTWSVPSSDGGSPITTYKIYRGTTSGVERYLTDVGNVLTYVDTSLTNGQTYYYKISAVNSLGEGPQSNEVTATPATTPLAPQNLQSQAGDSYILLAWIAPSSDGGSVITNYTVFRGTSSSSLALLITLGNVLTYNDTSVTNGVTYYYEVHAVNSLGESPSSNQVSATPETGIVHTVPSAPQNLQAIAGNLQVTLTWSPPLDNGGLIVKSYKIYRGTSPGTENYLATVGNFLSFIDHPVSNEITYYYKVSAINNAGEGAFSNEVSATPSSATPPSAPQSVNAKSGNSYIILTWRAPSNNGSSAVISYNIYRGTESASLSLLTTVGNTFLYNDTSVVNGQKYYYRISAVNDVGEGNFSGVVSATPSSTGEIGKDNNMLIIAVIALLALIAILIVVWAKMRKRK